MSLVRSVNNEDYEYCVGLCCSAEGQDCCLTDTTEGGGA